MQISSDIPPTYVMSEKEKLVASSDADHPPPEDLFDEDIQNQLNDLSIEYDNGQPPQDNSI